MKKRKIEKLLDIANLGHWKWDLDTNRVFWSKSIKRIYGIKSLKEGESMKRFINRIYILDRERVSVGLAEAIGKEQEFKFTYRVVIPKVGMRFVSSRGIVFRNDKKEPQEVQALCIDITKSTDLERELKKALSQLEAVFGSVPAGITVEVSDGSIIYANLEIAKFFGFDTSEEVVGKNIKKILKKFIIKDDLDQEYTPEKLPASEIFKGKRKATKTFHFTNKLNGSSKWLKITATAVNTGSFPPEMVIKVFLDVTREYEKEQNTQTALGMASHELKNALAAIRAYIQLVRRKINGNDIETAKTYVEALSQQSDRLIKLINDLLEVSRIQAGLLKLNVERFDYSKLINGIVRDFKNANPDYKIISRIQSNMKINADETRVVQVLINLLTNAVKYSEKGSKIKIVLSNKNGFVSTKIQDNGIGIPRDEQKRIFEVFNRGNSEKVRQTKGLGVGLFMSNALVRAQGGTMKVFSRGEGKGSSLSFFLPLKPRRVVRTKGV